MIRIQLLSLLAVVFITACNEKPEQIIDSKVVESGMSELHHSQIEDEHSGSCQMLNYDSWIDVDVTTKASKSRRVSTNVRAELHSCVEQYVCDKLYFDDSTVSMMSRYELSDGQTQVGDYVTLFDSVFCYRVEVDGKALIDYRLTYQVPIYNDGVTRIVMPHHRIEFISASDLLATLNNSCQVDSENSNIIHAVKTFNHSIKVKFAEKLYQVDAVVELKKIVATDGKLPVVIQTEKIDGGIEEVSAGGYDTFYQSWMMLRHTLSDGQSIEEKVVEDFADHYAFSQNSIRAKIVPDINLSFDDPTLTDSQKSELRPGRGQYIFICDYDETFEVRCDHFVLSFLSQQMMGYFDNGLNLIEMPRAKYRDFNFSFTISDEPRDELCGEIPAWGYDMIPSMGWICQDEYYQCQELISLYVYK